MGTKLQPQIKSQVFYSSKLKMFSGKIFRVASLSVRQLYSSTLNNIRQSNIKIPQLHTFKRDAYTRAARARSRLRATQLQGAEAVKPSGFAAENTGRLIVGGACAAGVGALCFYGLGLSNEAGAIDKASLWPEEVRSRIKATYLYFTASLGVTAGSAYWLSRSQMVYRMMSASPWLIFGGSMVAMIGSSIACRAIEYEPGLNAKHLAWATHSGIVGCVIAPMMLLGGPLVLRAAAYTAGTVAALSMTAACAPDEKFLKWGGPLSLCLGGVMVAAIGGMFVPATSAAAPVINSVVTYGGLVVFGGFMLYDTQKIIYKAQNSYYMGQKYGPINGSIGIYMDTINIFIRILTILASGNRLK